MGEHAGVRRAPYHEDVCAKLGGSAGRRQKASAAWAVGIRRALPREGDQSKRGGDDAGAHARHMRRRTSGLCQLTLPPRSISRLSSASLPLSAASHTAFHTALPNESLIAPAALIRPAPARPPANSVGHARLRCDAREAAARNQLRCACAARPQALGARVAAAAVARGRVEDARSDHGAQSRLPQRLAPEAPSSVVWACEAAAAPGAPNVCDAGHRARRGHRARE